MSVALPFELWIEIASYLPDSLLKPLRSVNRAFLEASNKATYRHLQLGKVSRALNARIVYLSKRPDLARRVNQLTIDFNSVVRPRPVPKRRFETVRSLVGRVTGRNKPAPPPTADQLFSALLKAAGGMVELNSLIIYPSTSNHEAIQFSTKMLNDLWARVSGRVESLSSLTFLAATPILSKVFIGRMSNLTNLNLSIVRGIPPPVPEVYLKQFADVVNDAAPSLVSLRLYSDSQLCEPLDNINQIPGLKRLVLASPLREENLDRFSRFINKHRQTLQELCITIRDADGPFPFSFSSIQAPKLHTLIVISSSFQRNIWLGQLRLDNVTRLKLDVQSPYTKHDPANHLIHSFRLSKMGASLKELHLFTNTLNEGILLRMSQVFPSLHTLTYFIRLPSDPDLPLTTTWLKEVDPPYEWGLYNITIAEMLTGACKPLKQAYLAYETMKVAARMIPSIKSFCNQGHMGEPDGWEWQFDLWWTLPIDGRRRQFC